MNNNEFMKFENPEEYDFTEDWKNMKEEDFEKQEKYKKSSL